MEDPREFYEDELNEHEKNELDKDNELEIEEYCHDCDELLDDCTCWVDEEESEDTDDE